MTEDHRTIHAQQAFDFVDVFGYKFNALAFGKSKNRRLKLMEPDGPSTAGGRQARQSLVLVDDDDPNSKVVIGFLDLTQKKADIRSFNTVSQQFSARFTRKFDLERADFDLLLAELGGFLKIQKIDYQIIESAPIPHARSSAEPDVGAGEGASTGALLAMLALGMLIGFGLGYLVFGMSG